MKIIRILFMYLLVALPGSQLKAQCAPTNCLPSLPPYGGVCDTMLLMDTVSQFYSDFESFHITTNCFDGGLITPTAAGVGVIITVIDNFTYTGLPAGITASSNLPSYSSPANGCILFQGIPTEAGMFEPTINFLADVIAYPFSGGLCSGFALPTNDNAASYTLYLTIRPNASFTIPSLTYCTTDAAVNLTITGTTGGIFSGPGVAGTTFDPAIAGPGTHTITYNVSAQQGAAVGPASNSSSIMVTVTAPSYSYYPDADNDTYGDELAAAILSCSSTTPPGYSTTNDDCNDGNNGIHPGAIDIPGNSIDEDCDGSDAVPGVDADGDGYNNTVDCNDADSTVHPGAVELCDGIDNNCVGGIDEGFTINTYYQDNDNDGYGNPSVTINTCAVSPPVGYVTDNTDCNDANNVIHPGATELCDEIDNNCAGGIDEGLTINTYYYDGDFDGYGLTATTIDTCATAAPLGYAALPGDCDDGNVNINPGATEICDGFDNDCLGGADNGLTYSWYYLDFDNDTYGSPNDSVSDCALPSGYVTNNLDCDDNNLLIHPGVTDLLGNGVDENCDGVDGVLGISNLEETFGVSVHPNPASDFIYFTTTDPIHVKLNLYNVQGQLIVSEIINMNHQLEFNVSVLHQGIYLLELVQQETGIRAHQRLIISK